MKFFFNFVLFSSIALLAANAEKLRYTNYKLIRIYPSSAEQYKYINELEALDNDVDIWNTIMDGDRKAIDLVIPPVKFEHYSRLFGRNRIEFNVINENIQDIIDRENGSMEKSINRDGSKILFTFARYVEIMNFIAEVVEKNSDIASLEIIGTTAEHRILKVLKLRSGSPAKSIWIDCGIHAREWISPASCVYTITKIIQELREGDQITRALFDKYDFHILPIHNPDGYEYTFTERLWRKNRKVNPGSNCRGVDLNRNYPFYCLDPCSDVHAGQWAASEPETQAVINYIKGKLGRWDAFFSVHSFGNWWLTVYGHDPNEYPSDYNLILNAANVGVAAIQAFNGSVYIPGSSSALLYIATGGSSDWAYSVGIRYSYVLELTPGTDAQNGYYGFVLPEDQLPQKAPEAYVGIKAVLDHISKL